MKNNHDDTYRPRNPNRKVTCLHCGDTYKQKFIKYESRFGYKPKLHYCRNKNCNGAGLNHDLCPDERGIVYKYLNEL